MIAFTAVFMTVFALVAAGWLVMALQEFSHSNNVVRLGQLGMITLAVGAAALFGSQLISAFPRVAEILSPSVTSRNDKDWGADVRLNQESNTLPLLLILAGCATYGLTAWLAWRSGYGGDLLPFSRDDSAGATFALIFAIIALTVLALVLFAKFVRISVEMYPSGIIVRTPMRGISRIGWGDISGIRSDVCKLSAQQSEAPVVMATLVDSSRAPNHKIFDRTGELGIPACILRCNSDLLLALIGHLLENPESRPILASDAAPEWFTVRYHRPSAD
ncbi:hypothetical protein [Nocardia sp. MW-W600-9]